MSKKNEYLQLFQSVEDNIRLTVCANGFYVEISGKDRQDEWFTGKYILGTLDDLTDFVKEVQTKPKQ